MAFKYHRGVYVQDIVTGFRGCIVARTDSLTGCNRYWVLPKVGEDGKPVDGLWLDEHEIEVDTNKQQLVIPRDAAEPPG